LPSAAMRGVAASVRSPVGCQTDALAIPPWVRARAMVRGGRARYTTRRHARPPARPPRKGLLSAQESTPCTRTW
jgi:hypothetical protein